MNIATNYRGCIVSNTDCFNAAALFNAHAIFVPRAEGAQKESTEQRPRKRDYSEMRALKARNKHIVLTREP